MSDRLQIRRQSVSSQSQLTSERRGDLVLDDPTPDPASEIKLAADGPTPSVADDIELT